MRLRIRHETAYSYGTPATRAIQILRLTPRGHHGQFVVNWRIDVDRDCRLDTSYDPFGNIVQSFTLEGPLDGLTIVAEGLVETQDTAGVVQGQVERLPSHVYLRDTSLTRSDAVIRQLSETARDAAGPDVISILHAIMNNIHDRIEFVVNATQPGTSAIEAFSQGRGVCQDFSHIFIAAARHIGIPTRYVSGYLFHKKKTDGQDAGHAWAEALIDGLGWVAFDPANGISATDAYVRVAVGLDCLSAAPVRGVRYGGADEGLGVRILVNDATRVSG
ncbi:MAG: transglutaminase family protein [Bauldia sp.]|nr:transglutaminase family protein [Bauldia sp.]